MADDPLLKDIQRRMDGALEALRKEFGGLRTGRASASLLEPVVVNAYGNNMPLNQLANINVPEPRLITVNVWDRGMVKAVDKAIREAGLGLNPQTEGQTIRVPIPDLNEERRRELTKVAAKYAEAARVAVRNVRRDGIEVLRKEFAGLRTGRASASLLDPVVVEAYGNPMPLNQVGTVSVPEPRLIIVQVWDRGNVKATEKAIREAGLGLNPQTEGQTIRVPIPDLNEERRKELTKVAAKYSEQARVSVRNVRRDGLDLLKKQEKDHKITQDQHRKLDKDIQALTDETIKKIDGLLAQKDKEILQV